MHKKGRGVFCGTNRDCYVDGVERQEGEVRKEGLENAKDINKTSSASAHN